MKRRNFVKLSGGLAGSSLIPISAHAFGREIKKESAEKKIDFIYDGIKLSPIEYTQLLMKLVDEGKVEPDNYSNRGVVEELEESRQTIRKGICCLYANWHLGQPHSSKRIG